MDHCSDVRARFAYGRVFCTISAFLLSFAVATPAYAISLPWIGTALNDVACNLLIPGTNGSSWNCVLNWTGGAAIPGVGDIAVFNSLTVANITIDTNISVAQIDIQAGYTGIITQAAGSTITVGSSGFSQADGTFTGGDSAITINGPFSLSSGTFTATTGTTSITGDVTVSGGTFNHNSGLFTLSGTANQTINLGGKVLNNLTINNTGGGTSDNVVIANNSQLLLSGALTVTLGHLDLTTNTEPMVVEKGITLADAAQATLSTNSSVTASGTILVNDVATITVTAGTWTLNDDGDQTVDLDGQSIFNLTINDTGGGANDDIIIAGGGLNLSGALVVTLGNLDLTTNTQPAVIEGDITLANAAQATMILNSTLAAGGNITVNDAATLTASAGTITLNGTANQTIDFDDQHVNSLTINNTAGGTSDNIIVAAAGNLNVDGTLTITAGNLDLDTNTENLDVGANLILADNAQATLSGSTINVGVNVTVGDSATLTQTTGTFTLDGIMDQTIDLDGQTIQNLTINNTGGPGSDTITVAADGQLLLSGSLLVTLGRLTLSTNTEPLIVEGNLTLADNTESRLTTNTDITVGGNVTINDAATITTSAGTFTLNGTSDQTVDFDGQSVNNLTLNNSGGGTSDDIVIAASSPLLLSGSLTITLGNLDLATNDDAMVVERGITVADNAQATLTTDQNITASGSILINDIATITVTAGTLTLNDDGDQTVDLDGQSIFNLTVNDTGGGTNDDIVIAGGGLYLSGALTVTLGNVDLTTNSQALVIEKGLTLENAAQATLSTNSNVTASGTILVNDAATITVTAGTWTLNDDGDQTVDLDGQSIFNLTLNNTGGGTNDDVIIAASSPLLLSGSLTVTLGNLDLSTNTEPMVVEGSLTLANAAQATLTTNDNLTIGGDITVNDAATLTVSAGTLTLDGTADQAIDFDSQPIFHLVINNSGGGSSDDIVIAVDSQLLLSGSLVITLGDLDLTTNTEGMVVEKGITLADATQATLTTNSSVTASGTILINDSATITVSAGTWTLNDDGDQDVDLDGQSLSSLTINNTGGGTNDDVIIAGGNLTLTGDLTVTVGNLDLDTNTLSLDVDDDVTLAASTQATLSGSTMTIGGDILVASTATFTNTAGTVTLDGSSQSMSGALTFNNLTKSVTANDTLTFAATNTVTVTNTTTLQGTSSATLLLRSSQTGTQWKIDPQGSDTFLYLDIKDSNNINATIASCPTNCTDSGNNTNWSIIVAVSGGGSSGGGGGNSGGGGGGGSRRGGPPIFAIPGVTNNQGTGGGGSGNVGEMPVLDIVLQQAVVQGEVCKERDVLEDLPSRSGFLSAKMGGSAVVFKDVPVDAWFAPNIHALTQAGVASGYRDANGQPTGLFGAANKVTYAELVKMILETTQEELPGATSDRPDNASAIGHWSERYMKFAEDLGLSVYEPELNVNANASRGDVIETLVEAFDLPMDTQMAEYRDLDEAHPYAAAISTATRLCIIRGDTDSQGNLRGTVRPDDSINRAEVSEIIQRILAAKP